jgi:hypothetical protein
VFSRSVRTLRISSPRQSTEYMVGSVLARRIKVWSSLFVSASSSSSLQGFKRQCLEITSKVLCWIFTILFFVFFFYSYSHLPLYFSFSLRLFLFIYLFFFKFLIHTMLTSFFSVLKPLSIYFFRILIPLAFDFLGLAFLFIIILIFRILFEN